MAALPPRARPLTNPASYAGYLPSESIRNPRPQGSLLSLAGNRAPGNEIDPYVTAKLRRHHKIHRTRVIIVFPALLFRSVVGKNDYGKPIVPIFNNLIYIQFSIYIYVIFFYSFNLIFIFMQYF